MKIKTLVCDLDGSLFPACSKPMVSDEVKEALLTLQKQGVRIILNTARIFHGVYPLAKYLEMDKYGGYVVCCCGSMVYDMAKEEPVFLHDINKEDALSMWNTVVKELGFDFAIAQPSYMVCNYESEGFYIDRVACDIDYLCTISPEKYITDKIWKCAISMSEKKLDENFAMIKKTMEEKYDYKFVRSAECYIDISRRYCDKVFALNELFAMLDVKWEDTCIIGDGNSDAEMIRLSGYGVTLENGTDLCKKNAKRILPDIKEDGCLVLFKELIAKNM